MPELLNDLKELGGVFLDIDQKFRNADFTATLRGMHRDLERDHAGYFTAETDPNMKPWRPLSPVTIKRKGHDTILVETERLRNSLAGRGSFRIRETTHRGLIFGTSAPYAVYHQEGTEKIPQRAHVGLAAARLDAIVNQIADAAVQALKG